MSINLLIADDHPVVREGLRQLLELESDLKIIGQSENGLETIKMTKELKPDVLLLDINLPDVSGIEVLKKLKKENVETKIIMLTIHDEQEYIMNAIEAGCDGYVLKDADSQMISKAIRKVNNGEIFVQPSLAPLINSGIIKKKGTDKEINSLTSRELEVLKLLAAGMFNKEIANTLEISERTVKNHISNIFKKIHVADRTQAAVFAIKNDIISLK